ncbi:hypothetical protein BOTNAR_0134g00190 [Botryotinia narcissicola]|uniref:Uncharacterized protein n=1 Tax=Botryotinia narcissicola TaxID=278944 RepID=A0A4Z1IPD0_9HELO|nr:hypothetical protein BOTNAR_0134g00190 [Botryotinia narcissicola]
MAGQSAGSPKIPARPRKTKPIIIEIKLGLNGYLFSRMQQHAKSNVAGGIQGISNALQPIQLVRPAPASLLILC